MLRLARNKGITGMAFPKRFSYTSRIAELRRMRFDIVTVMEKEGDFETARYFLIGEPKP